MKSLSTRSLFVAVATLLLGVWVADSKGQQPKASATPPPGSQEPQGKEEIITRRVRLPITVLDKKGYFVSGLTKADFQVLEDKVPQQIESFSDDLGQTQPLYVAVLMDPS